MSQRILFLSLLKEDEHVFGSFDASAYQPGAARISLARAGVKHFFQVSPLGWLQEILIEHFLSFSCRICSIGVKIPKLASRHASGIIIRIVQQVFDENDFVDVDCFVKNLAS